MKMSNVNNNNVMPHEGKLKSGQIQEFGKTIDSNGASIHAEYPVSSSVPYPVHAFPPGPQSAYYSHGGVGYGDHERYSGPCQRFVPTITLTSHRIQFGCQQNQVPYASQQRFEEPNVRQAYFPFQPPIGKAWDETSTEHPPPPSKANNRGRTTYTDDQISELESVFNRNPYPTTQTRQHLACKIDVPEAKVKIWFQNRRARAKKFKMNCGMGPSWRMQMNDSRNADDQSNRNNNNLNSDLNRSSEAFPINNLLPLPTKPTISPWSTISNPPKKCSDGNDALPWVPSNSANPSMFSSRDYQLKYKPWGWGHHPNFPAHFPTVQRNPESFEPFSSSGSKSYSKNPLPFDRAAGMAALSGSWPPNSIGNVPDLITQTSRVGLSDSCSMAVEDNKLVEHNENHSNAQNSLLTEPKSESAVEDCVKISEAANPCDVARQSCGIKSSTAASSSPSYFPPAFSDRKIQPDLPCSMNSPPPIRRLVFPFHTLSDSKPVGLRLDCSNVSRPLGNYALKQDYPYNYSTTGGLSSGALAHEANAAGLQVARLHDSLQSFGYGNVYNDREKSVGMAETSMAQHAAWSLSCPTSRSSAVESGLQGNVKYLTSTRMDPDMAAQQIQDDDDIEEDEATDDAVDDGREMTQIKTEECEQTSKSMFNYASSNYAHYLTGWAGTGAISVPAEGADYGQSDGAESVQAPPRTTDTISNMSTDVISATVEPTSTWSNQLIGGVYPPSSASLVG